jgi:hypothetical protein
MHDTNADALDEAVRRIDKAFGPGYAKAHSELVAALVQAAAFDRGPPSDWRAGAKDPHGTHGNDGGVRARQTPNGSDAKPPAR